MERGSGTHIKATLLPLQYNLCVTMSQTVVAQKQGSYPLRLVGRARTFASRLPVEAFTDLSSSSSTRVYMYCWIDSERGQGAHVNYVPLDIAGAYGRANALQAVGATNSRGDPLAHEGEFTMTLFVQDNDPDLLKIMGCIRMKDDQSNNTRTATLAASAVQLDRLLMGEEQYHTMASPFDPGNYTEFVIRAANASDYANSENNPEVSAKVHIKLSRSKLWNMPQYREGMQKVQENMGAKMEACMVKPAEGGASFLDGETRYDPPSKVHSLVMFLTLFLGTPGYVLIAAGNSAEPRSSRGHLPSPRSRPIMRS